jgi:hypothetical protein
VEITESIIIPLSLFLHCGHVMYRWTRDLSLIVKAAHNNIDVIGVADVDQRPSDVIRWQHRESG